MIPIHHSEEQQNMFSSNVSDNFYCGVIEGFYGRPWTTEQRKLLFKRMEMMRMNMYVYAPKLDVKHRNNWRDLYSVEEAENFTNLIEAASEHNVEFVYALSPGLDVTFSSAKDIAHLKRKLQQVSNFGCKAFALLFDDIGLEMCKDDSEYFQSFAHAQVSITNQVYQHLNQPTFLFCPTEYCASRAVPTVSESEYLKTIGTKLLPGIEIFWTGPMVVSSTINLSSVEELTRLFGRPPLIWDNLHANDYDRRQLFLGPYSGRPAELNPRLKGVLTNPNCEFEANYIDMHTLMQWVQSNGTGPAQDNRLLAFNSNVMSSDIHLELEDDTSPAAGVSPPTSPPPDDIDDHISSVLSYHPRQALNKAILDWIAQVLNISRTLDTAPQTLLQPADALAPPINDSTLPIDKTSSEYVSDVLLSEPLDTLVETQENITYNSNIPSLSVSTVTDRTPSSHSLEAMDTTVTPTNLTPTVSPGTSPPDHVPVLEEARKLLLDNQTTSVTPASLSNASLTVVQDLEMRSKNNSRVNSSSMLVDMRTACSSPVCDVHVDGHGDGDSHGATCSSLMCDVNCDVQASTSCDNQINCKPALGVTVDHVKLLVDLYYQPFEHGNIGGHMLDNLQCLIKGQHCLVRNISSTEMEDMAKQNWVTRSQTLLCDIQKVSDMTDVVCSLSNQAVVYDLFPYLWSMKGIFSLVKSFITWLGCGYVINTYYSDLDKTLNTATSDSGPCTPAEDPDSSTFLGSLHGEFQNLLPLDNMTDLCNFITPSTPNPLMLNIRPYRVQDESVIYSICQQTTDSTLGCKEYPELLADKLCGAYLLLSPEFCFVIEDENSAVCGFFLAALNLKDFKQKSDVAWTPKLRQKYPNAKIPVDPVSPDHSIQCYLTSCTCAPTDMAEFPSIVHAGLLPSCVISDPSAPRRLLAVAAMALKSAGSKGLCAMFDGRDMVMGDTYYRLLSMNLLSNSLPVGHMRVAARYI